MTRRWNRTATVALGLLLTLSLAPRAAAQGTSGQLPGPMTSTQLTGYADWLGLSQQQRMAVESVHDDYKLQFRALRDGEIARFMKQQRQFQGGIPKREVIDEMLEELDALNAKITALDERMFDRIVPMLTESQLQVLPRIRLARARVRYRAQQTAMSYGRKVVDLSELFLDLDLPADVRAAADPQIGSYERHMTRKLREQSEAIAHLMGDAMDALEERGYIELTQEQLLEDAEMLQRLMQDMQEIFGELTADVAKNTADMRDLNKRTFRSVSAMLPPPAALALRNEFYRGAYPELSVVTAMTEAAWLTGWMDQEDLTDVQREALASETGTFQQRIDALLVEGIGVSERFWDSISPFQVNTEAVTAYQQELAELRTRASDLETQLIARLETTLGDGALDRVRRTAAAQREAAAAASAGIAETAAAAEDFVWSGDQFLPARVSRREVTGYARRLGLDDSMHDVLSAMHVDYEERFEQIEAIDELEQAKQEQAAAMTEGTATASMETIDRISARRRAAIEAIELVDDQLFTDLAALAGEQHAEAVERLRRERHLGTYRGSAVGGFALGSDTSAEAGLDLVTLVARQRLSDEEAALAQPLLDRYLVEAAPAFRARFLAQLDMQRLYDRWTAEITEASTGGDIADLVETQRQFTEIIREPASRVEQTNQAIIEVNRATITAVTSSLDGVTGRRLQRAYDRAAFPSVYDDPGALEGHIEAALALRDLSRDQRDQLAELTISYRPEYERISESMKGHLGERLTYVIGIDQERVLEWQQRQERLTRLRFDRNELNARAASRLRIVLSADQLARIGTLPQPQEVSEWPWGGVQ